MINTVEEWKEHVEISLGFKQGVTEIGDTAWTKRIYENFCIGEPSFGATCTNAMEATLMVIKIYEPDKYNFALKGLKRTIENYRNKGKRCIKLGKMYERISGKKLKLCEDILNSSFIGKSDASTTK